MIAVGIFGDKFAHQRQQFKRIHIVNRCQRLEHFGKFEHQQSAARLEHAIHFLERRLFVGHVAQAESHGNKVEIIIGKGQLFGIGQRHRQNHAFVEQAVAPHAEHGRIDVGKPHFAGFAHPPGPAARQIAGAAGNIEHFIALIQARGVDGEMLPHAVQAAGHHIVHDVVIFRHRVEHLGHFAGFFLFINGLIAEMGFIVAHVFS